MGNSFGSYAAMIVVRTGCFGFAVCVAGNDSFKIRKLVHTILGSNRILLTVPPDTEERVLRHMFGVRALYCRFPASTALLHSTTTS